MKSSFHILMRQILLCAIAIALLSLPFAHRAGAAPVSPEIAQYLAMGGNLDELCGDAVDHAASGCESCRISAAMLVALPLPIWQTADLARSLEAMRSVAQAGVTRAPYARPPGRAPPVR